MPVLLAVSILLGLGGLVFLSNATTGVGLIALACLVAIIARIVQAGQQHAAILKTIETQRTPVVTAPLPVIQ